MSHLEEHLALQIRGVKLPEPVREYRFAAHYVGGTGKGVRKRLDEAGLKDWRFDFAWPDLKLAVEVEGGLTHDGKNSGAHTRKAGFVDDCRKYGAAQSMGWTIYRTCWPLIKTGESIKVIEQLIQYSREAREEPC